MLRAKSHFYTGSRIVREGTLLEQVEPRFKSFVEEVTQEKADNDSRGVPEDPVPPTRKLLIHRPIKGGKSGPALKKAK